MDEGITEDLRHCFKNEDTTIISESVDNEHTLSCVHSNKEEQADNNSFEHNEGATTGRVDLGCHERVILAHRSGMEVVSGVDIDKSPGTLGHIMGITKLFRPQASFPIESLHGNATKLLEVSTSQYTTHFYPVRRILVDIYNSVEFRPLSWISCSPIYI